MSESGFCMSLIVSKKYLVLSLAALRWFCRSLRFAGFVARFARWFCRFASLAGFGASLRSLVLGLLWMWSLASLTANLSPLNFKFRLLPKLE